MIRKLIILLLVIVSIAGCGGKKKEDLYADGLKKVKNGNQNGAIVLFKSALEKDPNYLDARYQLGKAYLAVGKYDQAEKEFQKVLLANPGRIEIKLDLAKVHNEINKPDQAISEIQEYLKTNPETAESLETLAVATLLSNRADDAERYLLGALRIDPNRISARLQLARLYAAQKKVDQAKEILTDIIRKDPKEARAYTMLAQIESAQGNRDKAIKIYQELSVIEPNNPFPFYKSGVILLETRQTDKADTIADDLLKRFPKRGEGYRLKGMVYYQKKNFQEAIPALQKSIQLQPTIEGYYLLGMSQFQRKEYESALSQFRSILDRAPDMLQARIMTALILLSQKRLDDSIAEIKKVLAVNDRIALAHNMLGSAYMAKGMLEEGIHELERATELDPKLVDAHLKKGIYYLSTGNLKEAETDLKTAVQVAPDVLNTRLVLFSYYLRLKNYDKAFAVMKEGLNRTKGDAILYNNMAAIMFAQKKTGEGLNYFQKAKEADPAFLETYFNAAKYYAASGEQEKTLSELKSVIQKDPLNLKALLSLAGYYDSKGNDKEALGYLTKATETKNPAAYIALANYHMKKKESGKALSTADEAIKAVPNNADLLELKGGIYLIEKKPEKAIPVFDEIEKIDAARGISLKIRTYGANKEFEKAADQARRLIKLQPKSAEGYMVLAGIYEAQGDLSRATDELKKGIGTDPKHGAAYIQLGYTYAKKKDYAAALATFNDAIRQDPKSAPQALFAQGTVYEQQGKKQEAVKNYREVLVKSPAYVPALNNLAILYSDGYGGKPAEGLRLAETAVSRNQNNPTILDTYGYALLKNGRSADAKKVLEKVAAVLPENPSVNYHLALACRDTGDRAQAISRVNKALSLGRFPEESQARQLLAELNDTRKAR
jgi:putative PEP-CTERM system TPR-repeat lipoprotein